MDPDFREDALRELMGEADLKKETEKSKEALERGNQGETEEKSLTSEEAEAKRLADLEEEGRRIASQWTQDPDAAQSAQKAQASSLRSIIVTHTKSILSFKTYQMKWLTLFHREYGWPSNRRIFVAKFQHAVQDFYFWQTSAAYSYTQWPVLELFSESCYWEAQISACGKQSMSHIKVSVCDVPHLNHSLSRSNRAWKHENSSSDCHSGGRRDWGSLNRRKWTRSRRISWRQGRCWGKSAKQSRYTLLGSLPASMSYLKNVLFILCRS